MMHCRIVQQYVSAAPPVQIFLFHYSAKFLDTSVIFWSLSWKSLKLNNAGAAAASAVFSDV